MLQWGSREIPRKGRWFLAHRVRLGRFNGAAVRYRGKDSSV